MAQGVAGAGKAQGGQGKEGAAQGEIRDIAVGALVDGGQRVLLAKRPQGTHLGGHWELPGGKLEPGESPQEGLRRELDEEIGVRALQLEPLRTLVQHYPDRSLRLHGYRVRSWEGEPVGREGQELRWEAPPHAAQLSLPEGTRPILNALRLPRQWILTGDRLPGLDALRLALGRGGPNGPDSPDGPGIRSGLLLRLLPPQAEALAAALPQIAALCRELDAPLVVHRGHAVPDGLGAGQGAELGNDPVCGGHVTAAQLRDPAGPRPAGFGWPAGASCHSLQELLLAEERGFDYALLAPVQATASHPGAEPLGWERARQLIEACRLPVYLMGGLGPADLPRALDCGAQGVAGISAWGL